MEKHLTEDCPKNVTKVELNLTIKPSITKNSKILRNIFWTKQGQ